MSLLTRLLRRPAAPENAAMRPLYDAAVERARALGWYMEGRVPDTVDGRFDMLAAILSCVFIRLERKSDSEREQVWLTELFVEDMDGNLRQIGIGDMSIGKHVGKMMGALGGRLEAYRDSLTGEGDLEAAVRRNIYRGEPPDDEAVAFVTAGLRQFHARLDELSSEDLFAGQLPSL